MTTYSLRDMTLPESRLMIRYFLDADLAFLDGMGVEPEKLPQESEWFALMETDFARPIEERQFFYLVWQIDGKPIGHCNVNKIVFGESAYMHLHIWNAEHRRQGCATHLLRPSIHAFFETLHLKRLFCEPYAKNASPNRSLPKAGFKHIRTHETTPGWIAFHQTVNLWELDRETAMEADDR